MMPPSSALVTGMPAGASVGLTSYPVSTAGTVVPPAARLGFHGVVQDLFQFVPFPLGVRRIGTAEQTSPSEFLPYPALGHPTMTSPLVSLALRLARQEHVNLAARAPDRPLSAPGGTDLFQLIAYVGDFDVVVSTLRIGAGAGGGGISEGGGAGTIPGGAAGARGVRRLLLVLLFAVLAMTRGIFVASLMDGVAVMNDLVHPLVLDG
mmetsp:Transcript_33886/g.101120  ORF Transcript_33886/g.101120 Transcript_33886/m.101120 type:complete len:207 (+) Transcript_33886:682-1302(+)